MEQSRRKNYVSNIILCVIYSTICGIITGIIVLFSIFYFNNGQLRLYVFLGVLIGITLYMLLISRYFIKINVMIINFFKKIIHLLIKPFIIVLNFTKKLIFKPISFIIINMKYFTSKNLQKFKKVTKKEKKDVGQEGI